MKQPLPLCVYLQSHVLTKTSTVMFIEALFINKPHMLETAQMYTGVTGQRRCGISIDWIVEETGAARSVDDSQSNYVL